MDISDNRELARRWAEAFRQGDLATLSKLTNADTRIWHSYDGKWMSRDASALGSNPSNVTLPPMRDVQVRMSDDGFIFQSVIEAVAPAPTKFIVQVCKARKGELLSVEEYSAQVMVAA